MAAACVQEEGPLPENSEETAKFISLEDLQNQLQLSGTETLTVQVDNESGYIIRCGEPVGDSVQRQVITASGDSTVIACADPNDHATYIVTSNCGSTLGTASGYTARQISTNITGTNSVRNDTKKRGDLVLGNIASSFEADVQNFGKQSDQMVKEGIEQRDDKSLVEIAIQANDYDIERRSGKVPARRRVIPFKFRDYKNPELVDEEGSDSDSDYNPDVIDELPMKRKRNVARKSTTPGRRGRPRKSAPNEVVIVIQSSEGGNSTSQIVPYESLNASVQQTISSAIADQQAKISSVNGDDIQAESESNASSNQSEKTTVTAKRKTGKGFECEECHKVFSSKGNLKTHEKTHDDEKPFKCDFNGCGKAFRSNESLRRHRLSHMGIKPFECSICKNKFASNVSLQEHVSRHTDERPHQCHICQKFFRQVSCLRRHLFTHSTELPFSCHVCGRKFSQNVYLRSHMKVHTGERPFKCDECGKSFAHQSDLTRHKIVHTGRKPYSCEVCNAKFSDPSSKRRHEKEHIGVKPYVCQLCFESFKRGGQLKTHLSRKHTNQKEEAEVIQKNGLLQFIYKDGNSQTIPVSQADNIDLKDKKIVKLIKDLNNKMVQHVQISLPQENELNSNIEDLAAVETVVEEGEQNNDVHNIFGIQSVGNDSQNIQIQTSNGDETIITIAEVQELQEVSDSEVPVEYLQIIENAIPESTEQEIVVLPYSQGEETTVKQASIEEVDQADQEVRDSQKEKIEEETPLEEETQGIDFVANPDFNSQQYYNWLSSFTELCKVMPMPLDLSLFQKINQVHKTLSDVMATPSGVVADRDNFKILMNISQELNGIINEHLFFVMQNLETDNS